MLTLVLSQAPSREAAAGDERLDVDAVVAIHAPFQPPAVHRSIVEAVKRFSWLEGVDPLLVLAVIENESSFRPLLVSGAGCRGLMQVSPVTAREVVGRRVDLFDRTTNVLVGTRYLSLLIRRFGWDVRRALMGYNMGPNGVERRLRTKRRMPMQAVAYAERVLRTRDEMERETGWAR